MQKTLSTVFSLIMALGLSSCSNTPATSTETSSTPSSEITTSTSTVESEWETYSNTEYGFSFEYPKDWTLSNPDGMGLPKSDTEIIRAISPEGQTCLAVPQEGSSYCVDFSVHLCTDLNSVCTFGGGLRDGSTPSFESLEELVNSKLLGVLQKSSTMPSVEVDGLHGYGMIEGGFGANYEVLVDHNGIFRLTFPSSEKSLTTEQQHILDSFKFTK